MAVVEYLKEKGLVNLQSWSGGSFHIKITALGFQSLQDLTTDNAIVMGIAYKILFSLENRLRQFIESRMRAKHGPEWWTKHVSGNLKKNADDMRETEDSLGWHVSAANSNMEYLLFEDLGKIIIVNWKEVFEQVFHNQQRIILRLKELESMRNSIAHTRNDRF